MSSRPSVRSGGLEKQTEPRASEGYIAESPVYSSDLRARMRQYRVKGEDEKGKRLSLKNCNAERGKTSLKGRLRSKQRCWGQGVEGNLGSVGAWKPRRRVVFK